jgi:hypothetical protein
MILHGNLQKSAFHGGVGQGGRSDDPQYQKGILHISFTHQIKLFTLLGRRTTAGTKPVLTFIFGKGVLIGRE